jgi:YqaJ-like viral recombinase domain
MKVLTHFQQHSVDWDMARNGRITMSNAKALLTGGKGITRATYLQSVAAEILAGEYVVDHYRSIDMIRGNELEPYALMALSEFLKIELFPVGFVIADDERIGCSPDSLTEILSESAADWIVVEIKCPAPKTHLRYLDWDIVERDHGAQIQGEIWVCHAERAYFASFCPWVVDRPLIVHEFDRNEHIIEALEESAIKGADEVYAMVSRVRENSEQHESVKRIAKEAADYWASFAPMKDEVSFDE